MTLPPVGSAVKLGKHHVTTLSKAVWDSGLICSIMAAFVFSVNSLLVKLLDGRVPTTEIVLVRRYGMAVRILCMVHQLSK